jgi:abortive infection bacteriophage resistance protein
MRGGIVAEYTKPWCSVEEQISLLAARGVDVEPRDRTEAVLYAVGYYRLTGYLYPFRHSEQRVEDDGRQRTVLLDGYRAGTSIAQVCRLIDFDRALRVLVMDAVERIEVAVRMRFGYVLGRRSAFAHLEPETFLPAFVRPQINLGTGALTDPSKHQDWIQRVTARVGRSDETFVAHFKDHYEGQVPIWALTEVLELGHLSTLYRGLTDEDAQEIAAAFGAPSKKVMSSWLASTNYVRNVAAHHARLFNRKLQNAPRRPKRGLVPLLDHLSEDTMSKGAFGTYNVLAVIAYLLRAVDEDSGWTGRLVDLLHTFPAQPGLELDALGAPPGWDELDLWRTTTQVSPRR